jgi:hypothetical protein
MDQQDRASTRRPASGALQLKLWVQVLCLLKYQPLAASWLRPEVPGRYLFIALENSDDDVIPLERYSIMPKNDFSSSFIVRAFLVIYIRGEFCE